MPLHVRAHRFGKVLISELFPSHLKDAVDFKSRVKCQLTNLRRGILPIVDLQAWISKCG
jgi:hypothetical protein